MLGLSGTLALSIAAGASSKYPHSSDITPVEFFLLGHVKNYDYRNSVVDTAALHARQSKKPEVYQTKY
jgi:hypothetical protein